MTNPNMVQRRAATQPDTAPAPNCDAVPPVPAPEDSPTPTTDHDPEDSPHAQDLVVTRRAGGLTTRKE
ncbi:hypothetical protein M446_2721 [Methylobacterium sp. 4-46]|uniref:hypothetical protein n=1 Tax=unclassified Methylobacterium TaxID=2615210 RepID=UPI000165C79A|nr:MULTISPECIES: hypothetical protein [Methylobacterium]ACA17160.1 hypothetical protein M446_2721 [Methylobacterium sp. 4-46]WFT82844.1 hypothetical protein QA634_13790 [Methylobacterium nodulans]